ncbi:septal ring lytic transglycosylase RlpA family protein [Maricaulis sp. MIT060901]|uniref:septal ring lytic transglycosylase RlpA family protein n=1 Tax=Maricaulis sp. MIT060901 TaxID=3096993 RepID=UPI003999EAC3
MRALRVFLVLACTVMAAACSSTPSNLRSFDSSAERLARPLSRTETRSLIARSSDHQKVGNPYVVAGERYVPRRDDDYDEIGIGSWYGPTFHGRATANGEVFDQHLMTAAHTTLPIPSIAEVTNLENGRSVIVRINDRGPFVDDRIIDLSRAAAEELDYRSRGLARVRVRYLGPAHAGAEPPARTHSSNGEPAQAVPTRAPTPAPAHAATAASQQSQIAGQGRFTVQLGAFGMRANAENLRARVADLGDAWVEETHGNGRTLYRVYLGRWASEQAAVDAARQLSSYGIYDSRIVTIG